MGHPEIDYYLLTDGRVIPTTIDIPDSIKDRTFLFKPQTKKIVQANDLEPEGRFRRLPCISLTVTHNSVGTIDISDWLGEIRANPVPPPIPIKQLLHLWSIVHHQYIPLCSGTVVHMTMNDGDIIEETLG